MTGAKVPAMANGSHQYNDKREASRQSQHGVAGGSRRFACFSRQGHGFLEGSRVPFAWNTCRACRASGGRRAHGTRCDVLSRHRGNRRAALRGPHSHCAEGGLWRAWREPGVRGGAGHSWLLPRGFLGPGPPGAGVQRGGASPSAPAGGDPSNIKEKQSLLGTSVNGWQAPSWRPRLARHERKQRAAPSRRPRLARHERKQRAAPSRRPRLARHESE